MNDRFTIVLFSAALILVLTACQADRHASIEPFNDLWNALAGTVFGPESPEASRLVMTNIDTTIVTNVETMVVTNIDTMIVTNFGVDRGN